MFYCVRVCVCAQPPRMAHPQVRFSCVEAEPMVVDKVPFDKYELEPSPLTQYILERKSPHTCWQVKDTHCAFTVVVFYLQLLGHLNIFVGYENTK